MFYKFIKDSSIVGFGSVVTKLLSVIFLALIARTFTPADTGLINYNIVLATIASALIVTGFPISLSRFLGKSRTDLKSHDIDFSNSMVGIAFVSSLVLPLAVVILLLTGKFNLGVIILTGGFIAHWSYFGLLRGLFNYSRMTVYKIIAFSIKIVLFVLLVYLFGVYSPLSVLIIYGLSYVISLIIIEYHRPSPIKFQISLISKSKLNELMRFSIPLTIYGFAQYLFLGVDVLFLEYFRGVADVGQYSVAKALVSSFILVPDAVATVLMPSVAGGSKEKGVAQLKVGLLLVTVTSLFLILLFMAFGSEIIRLLFTTKYLDSLTALYILCIGNGIYSINSILGEYLIGIGRPQTYSKTQVFSLFMTLGGCICLIPQFGTFGAGLAFSIGCAAGLLVLGRAVIKHVTETRG